MITFLLIAGLIISLGFNVAAFLLIRILLKKIHIYEQWILEFKQNVTYTITSMREVDKQGTFATSLNDKGTFESDDQVGQIFKELLDLIEQLDSKIQ